MRITLPFPHIFLCAEFVLFLVVDESSFGFHVERNVLDKEKGVFQNNVSTLVGSALNC